MTRRAVAHTHGVNPEEPNPVPLTPFCEFATLPESLDLDGPLRLGGGEDVASAIPYLLGFHPVESVVALVCADRRLVMTARLPLELCDLPLELDETLATMAQRVPGGRWILAGYGHDRERVSDAIELVSALLGHDAVVDALYIDEGRFWSLTCAQPGCCPQEGRPYDASTSPAALRAVVAGLTALDRREDLLDRIRPPRGWTARRARIRLDDAFATIRQQGHEATEKAFERLLQRGAFDPDALSSDDLAMMTACVHYPWLRDLAFRRMTSTTAHTQVELWQSIVQATARDDQASALAMLGLACWISGDGAMQVVCLERGRKLAPEHPLLRLLDEANRTAAPPALWDELLEEMFGEGSACGG